MTASEYVDKLRNDFVKLNTDPNELDNLISVNNVEKRDVKGYHGREILELLQNADDAYQKLINSGAKPDCNLEIDISYFNNILTISNTGTFFDNDGVKAIVQGNHSPKKGGFIGSKGTGFRSVLNWATSVRIDSGDFHIKFSEKYAKEIFEQIKDKPQIKKQLENEPNLYVPILSVPENVDPVGKSDRTTIQIEVDPERLKDDFGVVRQIEEIDLRILLFLPNVSEIKIEMEGEDIVYRRDDSLYDDKFENKVEIRKLQKIRNAVPEKEEDFWVFPKVLKEYIEEDGKKKDVLLSVAIPRDYSSFTKGPLYTFFPLYDKESPFNCVLHATYILGPDRNTLVQNDNNKTILKAQIDFILEVAENFSKIKRYDIVWNILLPPNFSKSIWKFLSIDRFGLEGYYLDSLLNKKVFENVNGDSISIQDCPKIIEGNVPPTFCGELFNKLLKFKDDDDGKKILFIRMLFKYYQMKKNNGGKDSLDIYQLCLKNRISWISNEVDAALIYKEQELCEIINQLTEFWNVDNRVEAFIWWNCFYKLKKKSMLPKLLKKQNGEWLAFNEECYFLTGDFEDVVIPEWVKTPALCNDESGKYQDELFSKTKILSIYREKNELEPAKHVSRIICDAQLFRTVNFHYRDKSMIISPVNSSVDSYEKAVSFVKWLWDNYSEDNDWYPPDRTLSYNFPTKIKAVEKGKNLVFGKSYGNELAEILFEGSNSFFPEMDEFKIDASKRENFRNFIQKFGVKYSPTITNQEIKGPKAYFEEVKNAVNIEKMKNHSFKINLPYIQNLESILQRLKTDTFKWILWDKTIQRNLLSICYPKNSDITIKYDDSRCNPDLLKGKSDAIPNYILFIFKSTPWISINGTYFAPQKCTRNQIKAQSWYKEIKDLYSDYGAGDEDGNILDNIFQNLGVNSDNLDLSPELFYEELLKLDDYEEMVQLYRKIANSKNIDRVQKFRSFNGKEKRKFLENGKVLSKDGNLCKATDAFFTSSAVLNVTNKPIMNTPSRQGDFDIFHDIFGVQQYKETIKVVLESIKEPDCNKVFEKDFKSFLPAYLARLEDMRSEITDTVVKRFKDLIGNVHLVSDIRIIVDDETEEKTLPSPYTIVKDGDKKQWFIYIGRKEYEKVIIADVLKQIFYVELGNPAEEQLKECSELFVFDAEYRKKKLISDYGISEETLSRFETILYNLENYADKIQQAFPGKWNADVEQLIRKIDFTLKKQERNLVDLLLKLDVKISDFNTILGLDLSLGDYNKKLLKYSLEKLENIVYCSIADSLSGMPLEEKKKIGKIFEEIEENVKTYSKDTLEIENFNADKKIEEIVTAKVGVWSNDPGRYSRNKTRLLQEVGIDKERESQYISNLLFFNINWDDDTDEVACTLKKELLEQMKSGVDDSSGGDDVPNDGPDGGPGNGGIPPSHWQPPQGGGFGGGDASNKGANNKNIGDIGEKFIYDKICKKEIEDVLTHVGDYDVDDTNIEWVSSAAGRKKRGKPRDGRGYDIAVNGKDQRRLLIEVKTSTQRACSFHMTLNEINKARSDDYKNDYAVIFVYYDKACDKCEYWYIGNPLEGEKAKQFDQIPTEYHIDYRETKR